MSFFFGRRGKDEKITEEELLEIHELKAEQVLTEQEEEDLESLKGQIEEAQNFLHFFLRSYEYFQRNVNLALSSPEDDLDHNLSYQLQEHQKILGEANQRLGLAITRLNAIVEKAQGVHLLILSIERGEVKLEHIAKKRDSRIQHLINAEEHVQKEIYLNLLRKGTLLQVIKNDLNYAFSYINSASNPDPAKNKFIWAIDRFNNLKDSRARGQATIREEANQMGALHRDLNNIQGNLSNAFRAVSDALEHVSNFKHWLTYPIKESKRALGFQRVIDRLMGRCGNCGKENRATAKFCGFCGADLR